MRSKNTRLRFVFHEKPEVIQAFCDGLDKKIEVYGIVYAGNKWYLWFVPPEGTSDMKSGPLQTKKERQSNG